MSFGLLVGASAHLANRIWNNGNNLVTLLLIFGQPWFSDPGCNADEPCSRCTGSYKPIAFPQPERNRLTWVMMTDCFLYKLLLYKKHKV